MILQLITLPVTAAEMGSIKWTQCGLVDLLLNLLWLQETYIHNFENDKACPCNTVNGVKPLPF